MYTGLYNFIAIVFICGVIWGIRLMNSPETAIKGNLLGSLCVLGSVVLTLVDSGVMTHKGIWAAIITGSVIGYFLAVKVAMTQMPQLVALLNGLGGGASAIVAFLALSGTSQDAVFGFGRFAGAGALAVGAVTLSGSIVAAAKLDRKITQLPVILKAHTLISTMILTITGILIILMPTVHDKMVIVVSLCLFIMSSAFGILFAVRIGGADMPIAISLLNSLSGLAASIAGFAISDPLLVAIGAIVGSAGLILTQIMCRAMNRNIMEILTGRTVLIKLNSVSSPQELTQDRQEQNPDYPSAASEVTSRDVGAVLKRAAKIVIVPGYGMALAQAQFQVSKLFEELEKAGKDVLFAIHPVAGRMPGHMNILLAEAGIPYDKLCQMEDINPIFSQIDVVIVIGANDVINPAAKTAQGTPIYGMPILNVSHAKHVIICNKDTGPGYAGVDNPLYTKKDNVTLLLGDAGLTLQEILQKLN